MKLECGTANSGNSEYRHRNAHGADRVPYSLTTPTSTSAIRAVHELVQAKIEQRAPEIEIEPKGESPKVINIMDALKKSMQAKGQTKVKDAVRNRMGKAAPKPRRSMPSPRSRTGPRRTAH